MSTETGKGDDKIDRDPTQLVPPKIDTRMGVKGVPFSEGVTLIPGLAIIAIGLIALISGYNPIGLFVLGLIATVAGAALIFGTSSEYSSSRDLAKGGLSFARLQRRLPLSEDETAREPFHGITRIYANGMAETKDGELVAMVRAKGRNTDSFTESESNALVGQLSQGIDHDIRNFDFKFYSTTYDVDPAEVADRYTEQADSEQLAGDEWLPARELLRDVSDWFINSNSTKWGTTKWRHYIVLKVGEEDIDTISRQDKTKSRGERIIDKLAGQASQSTEAKRQRMKQKLKSRVGTVRADVLGSISGTEGTVIGPEEHAFVLSEYYAGAAHSFEDIDIDKQTQLSVWPGYSESGNDSHAEPSHRPAMVDGDSSVPSATEQSGVVGTPTEPYGGDPGSGADPSIESGNPAAIPSGGTENPNEVFDDEETADHASYIAKIRDGLLGGIWSDSGGLNSNQEAIEELKQRRNELEKQHANVRGAVGSGEIDQADADESLASIEEKIAEVDAEIEDRSNIESSTEEERTGEVGEISDDNPIQDILASEYDTRDGVGIVGRQMTKTFWVADLPTDPQSLFLRDLYTLTGIDLDVTIHSTARDKDATISELDHQLAQIGAEIQNREDEGSEMESQAAGEDSTDYERMWTILRNRNTQPWDVSMYITVRVGERRALEYIQNGIDDGTVDPDDYDLQHQKRRALNDACKEVKNTITSSPARLVVVDSSTRQKELFESCSPNGNNVYDQVSVRSRSRLTMGGTVGAMFPFCTSHVRELSGVEQGRSIQNRTSIISDPFERGGAPHKLTIAKSGSGKTYSVGKRALRWWLSDTDRTLILCDTMGGFAGLTEICNGEHIVVDGSQTINPLDITKPPKAVLEESEIDAFRMKIDEFTQFLTGIIRSQGGNPGDYIPVIEEIAQNTYNEKGIKTDPETHDNESPTMTDFLQNANEMLDADTSGDDPFSHEKVSSAQSDLVTDLLTKLTGFKDGGKYQHLDGKTGARIQSGQVTYLDLQQIEGSASAEKSTMLHLMLGQVYQAVKRAPKKSMFVIDEAHYLLHSEEMVNWLQRAARHWRHYDAAMWFVSQSPKDFAPKSTEEGEGRETITGQCSTIEFFKTPELKPTTGKRFGLNKHQMDYVKQKATSGSAGRGFSQGLISFSNIPGWMRMQVSASKLEDVVLTYDTRKHGAFGSYLEERTGIDSEYVGATLSGEEERTPEVESDHDGEIEAGTSSDVPAKNTPSASSSQPPQEQTGTASAQPNGGSMTATAEQNGGGSGDASSETVGSQYDHQTSIRALEGMSEAQATELELRNMGKVGDLLSNDAEAIANAGGVSVGEVHTFKQELTEKSHPDHSPTETESPYPDMEAGEMSTGPSMNSSNMATGPNPSDSSDSTDD